MSQTRIPIKELSSFNIQLSSDLTRNVKPLLHQIKHGLNELITNAKTSIIDLRSIPLAPGEESNILETLGHGEVYAKLSSLGSSEIIETQYAGVWVITHYNDNNDIVGRFIEITSMPEILCSQEQDMVLAYHDLSTALQQDDPEVSKWRSSTNG